MAHDEVDLAGRNSVASRFLHGRRGLPVVGRVSQPMNMTINRDILG